MKKASPLNITKTTQKAKKLRLRRIGFFCLLPIVLLLIAVLGLNACVVHAGSKNIVSSAAVQQQQADCILVLGCAVHGYEPSLMLKDRLNTAVQLYKSGAAKKIIMSGDHKATDYNEVGVMKAYAMLQGVPDADIFMDPEGLSTYDSLYLAKNKFGCRSVLVVTQPYHLYRALYTAGFLGLKAKGVPADGNNYGGQFFREVREIAARNKDFLVTAFVAEENYTGPVLSLTESGTVTNDADFERVKKAMGLAE